MQQIKPYAPLFHLNQIVEGITVSDGSVAVAIGNGTRLEARAVVIASGLGAFGADGRIVRPDPLAGLPLERSVNGLAVSAETFRTSCPRIYAIGDACQYPGKLRLILSGFHEAALMTQAIRAELRQASRLI